jgi:hypothetical protein
MEVLHRPPVREKAAWSPLLPLLLDPKPQRSQSFWHPRNNVDRNIRRGAKLSADFEASRDSGGRIGDIIRPRIFVQIRSYFASLVTSSTKKLLESSSALDTPKGQTRPYALQQRGSYPPAPLPSLASRIFSKPSMASPLPMTDSRPRAGSPPRLFGRAGRSNTDDTSHGNDNCYSLDFHLLKAARGDKVN